MGKDNYHAFDTKEMYTALGIKGLEEFVIKTGFRKSNSLLTKLKEEFLGKKLDIDTKEFLKIFDLYKTKENNYLKIFEVGCGYGRIGNVLMNQKNIYYQGIELNEIFVNKFRSFWYDTYYKNQIIKGDFLEMPYRTNFDYILFPWSVIGDFSENEGQLKVLKKSNKILKLEGKVLIDIPLDLMNNVSLYTPAPFNVHEIYDIENLGFKYSNSYYYTTLTNRHREIIELQKLREIQL